MPVVVWLLQAVARRPPIAAPSKANTSASEIVSLPRFRITSAAASAFSTRYPESETAVRSIEEAVRPYARRNWTKAFRNALAAAYAA
jgi:hypothetical protein